MLAILLVWLAPPVPVLDYTTGQAWCAVLGNAAVERYVDPPGFGGPR